MQEFFFRGIKTMVTPRRIDERDPSKFYYEIRHAIGFPNSIRTLEHSVMVDFAGTLVSEKALNFRGQDYIYMAEKERKALSQLLQQDKLQSLK